MQNSTMRDRAGATSELPDGVSESEEFHRVRRLEAEHRYRNILQMLGSLARLRMREAETEEAREFGTYFAELVDTLGALESIASDGARDDLAKQLHGMARHWQRLCNGGINIVVDAQEPIDLAQDQQTVAVLIAQELVINAIKHAFPDGRKGTIRIQFGPIGAKSVRLVVDDNGVGAAHPAVQSKPAAKSKKPHGATLVQSLSTALGGAVERGSMNGGAGHRVTVTWPR